MPHSPLDWPPAVPASSGWHPCTLGLALILAVMGAACGWLVLVTL